MRPIWLWAFLIFAGGLSSCQKDKPVATEKLSGTWIFTDENMVTFAPHGSQVPMSSFKGSAINFHTITTAGYGMLATSSMTMTDGSIRITFNGQGTYTFASPWRPDETGHYRVVQDSLLVIQPDSADFIKFNYPTMSVSAGSVIITSVDSLPAYDPYDNDDYQFIGDTVYFTCPDNHRELTLATSWISKAAAPTEPFWKDTLLLQAHIAHFRRQP